MALNKSLVDQSCGLLAPLSGKERFMSVGTSQTCAFFRAVQANCKQPESCSGEITIQAGEPLADILDNGWSWLVISGMVEQTWPDLPRFYQMALNAHVTSLKQMSEVEAAAQIALGITNGLSLREAMDEVKSADPLCKASLDAIGYYASHFGGGDGMPLIQFLSAFSSWQAVLVDRPQDVKFMCF